MRTAGIVAGVIATASANLFTFEKYSNNTEANFASADVKEFALQVANQVVEGNQAFIKGTTTITTNA